MYPSMSTETLGVDHIIQGTLAVNQSGTSSFGQAKKKNADSMSGFALNSNTTSMQYHPMVD